MKRCLYVSAVVSTILGISAISTPAIAADVGVSVSIGQPGFYGRIDIGDYPYPQPRVIYRQPRVVERVYLDRDPVYLRVPPGHRKNWSKHCHRYNACGERVYFVQDSWYEREYVPYYHERQRNIHDGDYRDHDGDHGYSDDRGGRGGKGKKNSNGHGHNR